MVFNHVLNWCQHSLCWATKYAKLSKRYTRYILYSLGLYKKGSHDRACFYISQHLRVHHDSMKLPTGKCAKLVPPYCVLFIVLKHIDSFAYLLNLLVGIKIHPVCHVSHLKELLVLEIIQMLFEDLASKPQKPERILDSKTVRLLPRSERIILKPNSMNFQCKRCNFLDRGSKLRA